MFALRDMRRAPRAQFSRTAAEPPGYASTPEQFDIGRQRPFETVTSLRQSSQMRHAGDKRGHGGGPCWDEWHMGSICEDLALWPQSLDWLGDF
jgi:hypothetical protein